MSMAIHCPNCKALFRLDEEMAGKKVRCQKCQQIFVVTRPELEVSEPAPEPEAPPEASAAPALPNMEIGNTPVEATSVASGTPTPEEPRRVVLDYDDDEEFEDKRKSRSSKDD